MAQPTQPFAYDVFISYSSQDKTWVRGELLTALDTLQTLDPGQPAAAWLYSAYSLFNPLLPRRTALLMSTPQAMYRLTVVLAELYPDKASAIRVAESAALPTALVALNDRAIDNWHAILQEAAKQDRLAPLVAVVHEEYGASPQWRAVMLQLQGWPALLATLAVTGQPATHSAPGWTCCNLCCRVGDRCGVGQSPVDSA